MANLEISSVCNLSCPFCFASEHMHRMKRAHSAHFIAMDTFEKHLTYLTDTDVDELRLIGGEPTLHPQFPEIIERAHRRDKPIMVFSHGVMSDAALSALEALPPEDCTVLINMNAAKSGTDLNPDDQTRRMNTIQRLGSRILLGYNIYKTDFQLDFLIPIILETNAKREIRLGLAHPTLEGSNHYLHPKQYPIVGAKIARFSQLAAQENIVLDFDCGFVRCMFTDEDFLLLRNANANIAFNCGPIIDVDIEGAAFHCYPLAGKFRVLINEYRDIDAVRTALKLKTELYRTVGIYRECTSCAYKLGGECSGGGLEHIMRRFRHTPMQISIAREPVATGESRK